MGLEVRGINHKPVRDICFTRQFSKNPVEDAKAAPADKPVIDRLGRAVVLWRITPA